MKKGEIAFYLITIILAVAAFLYAGTFPSDAAFFPRAVSVAIIVLSAIVLIRSFQKLQKVAKEKSDDTTESARANLAERRKMALKVTTLIAMLVLYSLSFDAIGYIIPTVLLVSGTMLLFGNRKWKSITIISVMVPVALYVIFRFALNVNFPADSLFF